MKVYFLQAGVLKSQKQFFTSGRGVGEPFDVPVPYYLIEHPQGYVMFDTGNAYETIHNKKEHWGDILSAYDPVMTEEQWCVNSIKKLGVQPEDIKYVICSHLHLDHAGGVGHFPNARYVVQRSELHFAYVPDPYMKGAYIRKDFDKDVDWLILEGEPEFDLFGDGKIVTVRTPGHTPGHMSLKLKLENTGPMVLAVDAAYTQENLDERILPGLMAQPIEQVRSIELLRHLQDQGWKVITGHDPETWKTFKKAPEYYD